MDKFGFSRVIVWGHRPVRTIGLGRLKRKSHTHSYIHAGYANAFRFLGYETHWIDSLRDLKNISLDGALVFTEGQVDDDLPIDYRASYVTHHSDPSKYEGKVTRWLKLHNFVTDLQFGISYNYPGHSVERINDVTYFDSSNKAIYMPWATDLLPGQTAPTAARSQTQIHYVGTVNHDGIYPRFRRFSESASLAGFEVHNHAGVSDSRAMALASESKLVVDIRGDWHLERGYIPCRIWKALSYGRTLTSNSPKLYSVFSDRIGFAPEGQDQFAIALRREAESNIGMELENREWVMTNHTFVNRVKSILEVL